MGVCFFIFLIYFEVGCNLYSDFVKSVSRELIGEISVKIIICYGRLKFLFHNRYLLINKQNLVIKLLF